MIFEVSAKPSAQDLRHMKRFGGFWMWDNDSQTSLVCMPDAYQVDSSEDFWMWHMTTWDLSPVHCMVLAL